MALDHIDILQSHSPGSFINPRVVHIKTPDNKEFFVLSGVVLSNLKGESQWRRGTLTIAPTVPVPSDKVLVIEQGAPFVTMNAIYNREHSVNSGFAVDAFRITSERVSVELDIEINFAVRDIDAWLYRVGYTVTIVGRYIDAPQPPD